KLQKRLLPQSDLSSHRQLPDYEAVHKELAKSGVTLSLLWNEYCESCRQDAYSDDIRPRIMMTPGQPF
ncbi:MAG: hypothetical protein KAZ05_04960, partial [Negativicutes bacterium]|nr:hypothetical protein [Negativicutes bacterium]